MDENKTVPQDGSFGILATTLLLGEVAVAALTMAVYLLIGKFGWGVVCGSLLGTAVALANFLWMAASVDRLTKQILDARGKEDWSEEQQETFIQEHKSTATQKIRLSFLVRNIVMIALLIVALTSRWFDPVATLIPLLMFRPLIALAGWVQRKKEAGR